MYKLIFFVPVDYAEQVKAAVFAAGAGQQDRYAQCCFQSVGKGQFMPLTGARPFIGEPDHVTRVEEFRIEMRCPKAAAKAVISALKNAHPYEVPTYDLIELVQL